ncbi:hypothetical protein F5I97DRAFT_1891611 [Phlebopus sp. FC_14]|nr:hypothetical protein F5I97DRAFT_1891611 [Phlebopus sp. FC_14]
MIARSPVKTNRPPSTSAIPSKRTPTPLRSTINASATTSILTSSTATGSTSTPNEAMVASQQAHINDLVQRNRALEHTIKKLNEELAMSVAEYTTLSNERKSWEADRKTWAGDHQKWIDERKVWAAGCDTIQACHRIQQYRMACRLQDERVAVMKMQEVARNERLKRLQRDYKITMFQTRESELMSHIEEVGERCDQAEEAKTRYEKFNHDLETKCAGLVDEVKTKTTEVQDIQRQREQVEDDLRRLREAHADATATTAASSSKLSRLTTQRDALQAQVTSLQHSLEVAQDETAQLRTQLTNWQTLKKGEDMDSEEARKKKVELEMEVREARRRIGTLEARVEELEGLEARLEKEKGRVQKLKGVLEDWKVICTDPMSLDTVLLNLQNEANEQTTARENAETRLTSANAQISTLEKQITDLRAELASKPKSKNKSTRHVSLSDDETVHDVAQPSTSTAPKISKPPSSTNHDAPRKPRPKPRPVKQREPFPEIHDSEIEILINPPPTEPSAKAKAKRKTVEIDDNDANDVGGPQKKTSKTKRKVLEIDINDASDMGEPPKKTSKAKQTDEAKEKGKGKKAKGAGSKKIVNASPSDDSDGEHSMKPKFKPKSKKRTSPQPSSKATKPKAKSSRALEDSEDTGEAEADPAPKKKKRKIGLFGGAQPVTFNWDTLGQDGETLGIPRQLSPMKATDVVPRRLGRASG